MRLYAAGNAALSVPTYVQGAADAYAQGNYGAVVSNVYQAGQSLAYLASFFGSCFAAGTPLLTPEGSRPIEALRPGDLVLAAPEGNPEGPVTPRLVEQVFRAESALVTLEVGGRSIRTTAEHPFWVEGRGWTKAADLIAGDRLRCADGRRVVVAGVRDAGEIAAVYNLRVAADHTYFVGAREWGFSVWAHNECWGYRVMSEEEYQGASQGLWNDSNLNQGDEGEMGMKWLWEEQASAEQWREAMEASGNPDEMGQIITMVPTAQDIGEYLSYPHPPQGTAFHVPIPELGPAERLD